MMRSIHRRQDIIDQASSRLDDPLEGSATTPLEPDRAGGKRWPQIALSAALMIGFLAIPLAILVVLLNR